MPNISRYCGANFSKAKRLAKQELPEPTTPDETSPLRHSLECALTSLPPQHNVTYHTHTHTNLASLITHNTSSYQIELSVTQQQQHTIQNQHQHRLHAAFMARGVGVLRVALLVVLLALPLLAQHAYGIAQPAEDGCPGDPLKTEPGQCGCGVADADRDGDGTADCVDGCARDPKKTAPGVCGCHTSDVDVDGDGIADCLAAYCSVWGVSTLSGDGPCKHNNDGTALHYVLNEDTLKRVDGSCPAGSTACRPSNGCKRCKSGTSGPCKFATGLCSEHVSGTKTCPLGSVACGVPSSCDSCRGGSGPCKHANDGSCTWYLPHTGSPGICAPGTQACDKDAASSGDGGGGAGEPSDAVKDVPTGVVYGRFSLVATGIQLPASVATSEAIVAAVKAVLADAGVADIEVVLESITSPSEEGTTVLINIVVSFLSDGEAAAAKAAVALAKAVTDGTLVWYIMEGIAAADGGSSGGGAGSGSSSSGSDAVGDSSSSSSTDGSSTSSSSGSSDSSDSSGDDTPTIHGVEGDFGVGGEGGSNEGSAATDGSGGSSQSTDGGDNNSGDGSSGDSSSVGDGNDNVGDGDGSGSGAGDSSDGSGAVSDVQSVDEEDNQAPQDGTPAAQGVSLQGHAPPQASDSGSFFSSPTFIGIVAAFVGAAVTIFVVGGIVHVARGRRSRYALTRRSSTHAVITPNPNSTRRSRGMYTETDASTDSDGGDSDRRSSGSSSTSSDVQSFAGSLHDGSVSDSDSDGNQTPRSAGAGAAAAAAGNDEAAPVTPRAGIQVSLLSFNAVRTSQSTSATTGMLTARGEPTSPAASSMQLYKPRGTAVVRDGMALDGLAQESPRVLQSRRSSAASSVRSTLSTPGMVNQ